MCGFKSRQSHHNALKGFALLVLVLGQKYKFTDIEIKQLHKKNIVLNTINYSEKNSNDIIEEIKKYLEKNNTKIILLNTKVKITDEIINFLTNEQFEKKFKIIFIEKFMEEYLQKCYIPQDNTDLHYLQDLKPFSTFEYIQKRFMDYVGVFITFVVTLPFLIYSRYKIQKESPGNPIFKQLRVGQNNKEFECIKFRSMYLDAEKNGAQFASENDPRVFKWGDKMRRTRIDELPQMINVLKGDMHFIGPRPERKYWINQFEKQIPYYNERHIIKPGISGWAQVMYPYGTNVEDAKQKLMYDLYYIKHWSIMLELKVIWKTILVVLGRKGV